MNSLFKVAQKENSIKPEVVISQDSTHHNNESTGSQKDH